jgi:hypothetical protein
MVRIKKSALLVVLGSGMLGGTHAAGQCLSWSSQFTHGTGQTPDAILSFNDGTGPALYAGAYGVLRWNGTSWVTLNGLSGSLDASVGALGVYDDGSGAALYAGGNFDYPSQGLAKWNGATWNPVGGGLGFTGGYLWVDAMTVFDDGSGSALYVGGRFDYAFNGPTYVPAHGVIKWSGSAWSSLAGGISSSPAIDPRVYALAVYDDGTGPALYAGGSFTGIGGVSANYIAKWDGSTWSPLGTGVDAYVYALTTYNDGTGPALFVGGTFTSVGGVQAHGLAKWNGTTWSVIPGAAIIGPFALSVFDDGSGLGLYAGGAGAYSYVGNVARWDGVHWSTLGNGVGGLVHAMAIHDDGAGGGPDLYLGGEFGSAGDGILSLSVAEWYGCQSQIAPMCYGDGTFAPCPCHNSGAAGHGCQNSAGMGGALLSSTGTTIPDTFTLLSSFEPTTALTIFIIGDMLTQSPILFGDGIRCAGGNLLRLYVKTAGGGMATAPQAGDPSISQRSANLGFPIPPGSVRYFQTYYRDGLQSFCPPPSGSSFNVANVLRVIW